MNAHSQGLISITFSLYFQDYFKVIEPQAPITWLKILECLGLLLKVGDEIVDDHFRLDYPRIPGETLDPVFTLIVRRLWNLINGGS
jgi:hypothetical protein